MTVVCNNFVIAFVSPTTSSLQMIDLSLLSIAQLRQLSSENGLIYHNKSKKVLVAELQKVLQPEHLANQLVSETSIQLENVLTEQKGKPLFKINKK